MSQTTNSQDDLLRIMRQKAVKALEKITKEVIEIFKKDYVMAMVYNSHLPNVKYYNNTRMPTYEFLDAWDWSQIKDEVTRLSTEMWFDSNKLGFNSNAFLHGSRYSTPEDVRENLMDILNKRGYSSSLWISVKRPKAYWDEFIKAMFNKGDLEKIITKHFISEGFTRK